MRTAMLFPLLVVLASCNLPSRQPRIDTRHLHPAPQWPDIRAGMPAEEWYRAVLAQPSGYDRDGSYGVYRDGKTEYSDGSRTEHYILKGVGWSRTRHPTMIINFRQYDGDLRVSTWMIIDA